jgi:hypothetical protein
MAHPECVAEKVTDVHCDVRQAEQIARFDAPLGDGDASPVITQLLKFDRPRLCNFSQPQR